MFSVYRKEMRAYLVSPIPYVLTIVFAMFMSWYFFDSRDFFFQGTASMQQFFSVIPMAFVFLVPAITMRLWSEEDRGGTMETLLTYPVHPWAVVIGKFLSAWTLLLFCLIATFPIAITVSQLGPLDWGPVVGGYVGTLLLGGALLALGLWISSLTGHQIVAFLLTMIISLLLVLLQVIGTSVGGMQGAFLEGLSVSGRFASIGRGVLDMRDLLYFVSFTAFFLYLNAQSVENRRYL